MDYIYKPIKISDREPELENLYNDRLVQLDKEQDVLKCTFIGLFSEWKSIKHKEAVYWLEKTKINK